jgi:hypothetical protein
MAALSQANSLACRPQAAPLVHGVPAACSEHLLTKWDRNTVVVYTSAMKARLEKSSFPTTG